MKIKNIILSFIIPIVLLTLIFISNDIIFGDYLIFYSDSQHQYYPLLIYFKDFLNGINNLSYSFHIGMGSSFIATFAYYLSSPFNILLYFFDNIELFFIIQLLIKGGLCGLTMYFYLNYQTKSNSSIIFSTTYALSAYIIYNYFQIMWLDAYFLAPLLLLGIDKIINEKKHLLYGITLFFIVLSNYYMGYMCALFSVLYFIYKYLISGKKDKKIVFIFLITSLLCGLMTMFLHIPNLLDIMSINRKSTTDSLFNIDILGIVSKLYLGSSDGDILNKYHPYLYIGIFNIILFMFYFVNKNIDKKEKKLSFLFIFVLIASILFVPLNNFWHALSNPIGFNFRYIYLFNILIIGMCYKSFLNIKNIDKKWYLISLSVFLIISILVCIRGLFDIFYLFVSVLFFVFYLFMFYSKNKDIKILFYFLVIAELFFNGYSLLKCYEYTYKNYFNGVYNEKNSTINMIEDDSFYRMEFNKKHGLNDSIQYGYYGVSTFLSSVYLNEEFFKKIGYSSYYNMVFYNESIVLDSLFGIKYYETLDKNKYYDLINTNKVSLYSDYLYGLSYIDSFIYKNPYALSLGYMVDNKSKEEFVCEYGFDCQNTMFNNMIGYDNDVFEFEKVNNHKIIIKNNKDFYVLIKDADQEGGAFEVCIDDECDSISVYSNKVLFVENNYNIGDEIKITFNDKNVEYIYLAYIDFDNFKENFNQLKNNQFNVRIFEENYIKGNVYVEDKNVLFLSIPYNENFKLLVDGKKIEYFKLFDNFIGVDLEKGFHDIEIIYEIKGLKLGILISVISFVLFSIYSFKIRRKR